MDCKEIKSSLGLLRRENMLAAVLSLCWWAASFFYERLVFVPGAAQNRLMNYVLVKLITLIVMYALLRFFAKALTALPAKNAEAGTLIYALPVFVLVAGFWAVSNAWPIAYGDQLNILVMSCAYETMDGFFYYLTMYICMVAMNLFPAEAFTIIFKIFLISLAAGYCVYRLRRIYPSVLAFALYMPFLVPPGFYLSYTLHRAPMYAPFYMVFSCIILCDHLENIKLTKAKFLLLALCAAVLTQWRSEGIYLFVFAPVLLWLCYRPQLNKKTAAMALAVMMAVQLVLYIPQSIEAARAADVPGGRSLSLFECLITNMERKGLDKEKNAEDLAIVDKYLSVEAIHALNEENGDMNYMDNIIIYHGKRPGATAQDIEDFKSAVIRIVIKNPLVYIRTQLGAWSYISTANYYERKLDVISNVFTDLYVPTVWLVGLWIFLLIKKKWCFWVMTSCHLCHMAITTALLPAAYFKYYYSEYMYAVFSLVLVLLLWLKARREKLKT